MFKVAVADFNGDGKLDVAAPTTTTAWCRSSTAWVMAPLPLAALTTPVKANAYPWGIVTGDFNHDQHPDIAVVNEDGTNVAVLLNDGSGGFPTTNLSLSHIRLRDRCRGHQWRRLHSTCCCPSTTVRTEWRCCSAIPTTAEPSRQEYDVALVNGNATYSNPAGITVADLNGDGKLDFAVTIDDYVKQRPGSCGRTGKRGRYIQHAEPLLHHQPGFRGFLEKPYPSARKVGGHQRRRQSGSGVHQRGLRHRGRPLRQRRWHLRYSDTNIPRQMTLMVFALADVNGDGAVDVVAASFDVGQVAVLLNANGSGVQSSFTVGITTPTATVTAGSPATYNMALTGNNGYNGTVTFSCSGLPAHAACSFAPSSIVASGAAQSVAITITTTAATASLTQPALPNSKPAAPSLWASLGGLGIFGLVLAAETKKRNRRNMAIVLGILLLVMSFALVGCGSSSSSGPERIGWNSGGHLHRRSHRHRHGQRSGAQHEPHSDRSVRTHQHNHAAGRNLPAAFLF